MALLFCDSFDHCTTKAQLIAKWGAGGPNLAGVSSGRSSNSYYGNNADHYLSHPHANTATVIQGAAFQIQGNVGNTVRVFTLFDGASVQCQLRVIAPNQLRVYNGDGVTTIATGSQVLIPNVWYYIEWKVNVNNSGTYEVRIDGVTDMSGSADTSNTGNAYCNASGINGYAAQSYGFSVGWDDYVLLDTSGSAPNNDFIGDVRVQGIFPNGNGNSSVLVGSDSDSTDNYLLVDEASPNSDTDYVQGTSVGDKDTYAYEDLTASTGTVYGVQIHSYARKTDAGSRSIKNVARLSGTEEDSASDFALSTSYSYYTDMRETKPGGGSWSISDVNSAEFGPKVTV